LVTVTKDIAQRLQHWQRLPRHLLQGLIAVLVQMIVTSHGINSQQHGNQTARQIQTFQSLD
jgi:hypothetical protein